MEGLVPPQEPSPIRQLGGWDALLLPTVAACRASLGVSSSNLVNAEEHLFCCALSDDVDRTCTGSLLQCPQNLLQSTHATHYIHDDVGSAAKPDVIFSFLGVRCNELCLAAEAEWRLP